MAILIIKQHQNFFTLLLSKHGDFNIILRVCKNRCTCIFVQTRAMLILPTAVVALNRTSKNMTTIKSTFSKWGSISLIKQSNKTNSNEKSTTTCWIFNTEYIYFYLNKGGCACLNHYTYLPCNKLLLICWHTEIKIS